MNKYLIVLMAICLVNVHAFVKRDAPAAATPSALEELTKQLNEVRDKIEKSMDPEQVKKFLSQTVDTVNKGLDEIKKSIDGLDQKKA